MKRKPFTKTEMAFFYRKMREKGMPHDQAYTEVNNLIEAHMVQYLKNNHGNTTPPKDKGFVEAYRSFKNKFSKGRR